MKNCSTNSQQELPIKGSYIAARSGFTLIELLVVIAIIAILAAILFPVFARARENARRSSCQSNLKQIGLGVMQYMQDYDEKYPVCNAAYGGGPGSNEVRASWVAHIQPYVKSTQLFRCPSARINDYETTLNTSGGAVVIPLSHYGINEVVVQNAADGGSSVSESSIGKTSLLPLVADANYIIWAPPARIYNANFRSSSGPWNWYDVDGLAPDESMARHLGGSNIMYADGHVKFQAQGRLGLDASRSGQPNSLDRYLIPVRPQDDRVQ